MEPENTCLPIMATWANDQDFALRSQFPSLQRFPRSLLTAQPFPQVPNWPAFRAFSLSPFVSASAMAGQMCAPAAVTGGRFSPSPGRFAELVNGSARLSEPR
jgi:hypothetical protein